MPWQARTAVGSAIDRRIGFDLADDPPYLDLLELMPSADAVRMLRAAGLQPQPPGAAITDGGLGTWQRQAAWVPPDADEEMDLDCWYLSRYANLLRKIHTPDPQTWRSFYTTVRHALYREDSQTEAAAAMRTLWHTYLTNGRRQLLQLGKPRIVGPTFDDAFAVGDLVLGSTLVEIKTYADPTDALDSFLDQLLGYVLFDVEDRYAINAIAVYLAWHGELLTLPLAQVLRLASGQPTFDLVPARQDFRRAIATALDISHIYKHGTTATAPASPTRAIDPPTTGRAQTPPLLGARRSGAPPPSPVGRAGELAANPFNL